MVFDKKDPTKVTSLSVFVEGDDNPVKTPTEIHQPDNLESTKNGILVTEDPGSSQQFPAGGGGDPNATTARLWHVPLAGEAGKAVAARVDQSQDGPAGGDVDGRPPGNWGAWESTGIVDASDSFGPGMFLINIQAHTLWIEKEAGRGQLRAAWARLHLQARGRAAAAAQDPGRLGELQQLRRRLAGAQALHDRVCALAEQDHVAELDLLVAADHVRELEELERRGVRLRGEQ